MDEEMQNMVALKVYKRKEQLERETRFLRMIKHQVVHRVWM